ncbi:putative transcription factor interactor and regulator CCHC(Zn) family [Helianthus annuus]|nr:putative transcription factor interactor and regulator CCHC(Zn) family [Helianthus annuus]
MELIDIRWCMASVIRRAQRFMEITGRQSIGGLSTKLGFDKSKVTCFKCKQKGHFKRECRNLDADESANPFHDDYYRKAVNHRNREEPPKMKQIEDNLKEKSRALAVIQDDEGFNWRDFLPDENVVGYAFMAEVEPTSTYNRERSLAQVKMKRIYNAYKEAKKAKRWDPDRECYLDPKGNICVDPKSIDFEALVKLIPSAEEQMKIDAANRAERERQKQEIYEAFLRSKEPKKVDEEIIGVKKEMTTENLGNMADQVMMEKALEVDSTYASKSDSSEKVSSSGSDSEPGKAENAKSESVCRNCMRECKVCNTHEYLSRSKIQELTDKINILNREVIGRDKLIKGSTDRINELTEKSKTDENDVERFRKENEKLMLESQKKI